MRLTAWHRRNPQSDHPIRQKAVPKTPSSKGPRERDQSVRGGESRKQSARTAGIHIHLAAGVFDMSCPRVLSQMNVSMCTVCEAKEMFPTRG